MATTEQLAACKQAAHQLLLDGASCTAIRKHCQERVGAQPSVGLITRWRKDVGTPARATFKRQGCDNQFSTEEINQMRWFNRLIAFMRPTREVRHDAFY